MSSLLPSPAMFETTSSPSNSPLLFVSTSLPASYMLRERSSVTSASPSGLSPSSPSFYPALPRSPSVSSNSSSYRHRSVSPTSLVSLSLSDKHDGAVPQLGSAALYDPVDEVHYTPSLAEESLPGDSMWGSPMTDLSEVVATPPGTPGEERRLSLAASSHDGSDLLAAEHIKRSFPNEVAVHARAQRVAELSQIIANSANEIAALRSENANLKQLSFAAPNPLATPSRSNSLHSLRSSFSFPSRDISPGPWGEPKSSVESAWSGSVPEIQVLPSGRVSQPNERFAQAVLTGTIDYRELFFYTHPANMSAADEAAARETFQLRAEWLVWLLSGEHIAAKEGALRRGANALTEIISQEKRYSPRVVTLLDIIATAASELSVRPQGNYLIQAAFQSGRDVRKALYDVMAPNLRQIVSAQYGQHVVLKMVQRDDMRAWFVPDLLDLIDTEFLKTRGGTRVIEQACKTCSRDQLRMIYAKLSSVMGGQWVDCANSINGSLVVQILIELFPHNGDFSNVFLEEIFRNVHLLAANSHGTFVLHKLLIHPQLRSSTLLAIFHSVDPLCAGPEVAMDAIAEEQKVGLSEDADPWFAYVSKIVSSSASKVPSIVSAVQKPGGVALLLQLLKEATPILATQVRKIVIEHASVVQASPHGRESLSLIAPSLVRSVTPTSTFHGPFSAAAQASADFVPLRRPSLPAMSSALSPTAPVFGRRMSAAVGAKVFTPQNRAASPGLAGGEARWGITLGGSRF